MDASGRQSMATFERGTGDAIVTYENELLLQRKRTGQDARVRHPAGHPPDRGAGGAGRCAVVEQHGNRAVAEAFLAFLRSAESAGDPRRATASGPLDRGARMSPAAPPLPPHLFTMDDLGGWKTINKQVYGPGGVWDSLFTGPEQGR